MGPILGLGRCWLSIGQNLEKDIEPTLELYWHNRFDFEATLFEGALDNFSLIFFSKKLRFLYH